MDGRTDEWRDRCSSHVDSDYGYRRELGVPETVQKGMDVQLKQEWCLNTVSYCSAMTLCGFGDNLG